MSTVGAQVDGSGQLSPMFLGRQTFEPGIGSSIYVTIVFKTGFDPMDQLYHLTHSSSPHSSAYTQGQGPAHRCNALVDHSAQLMTLTFVTSGSPD